MADLNTFGQETRKKEKERKAKGQKTLEILFLGD